MSSPSRVHILQEAAGPPDISEPRWVTKTKRTAQIEDTKNGEGHDCEILPEQWEQISETASDEQLVIWIDGKKRFAYIVGPPGSSSSAEVWASQDQGRHQEGSLETLPLHMYAW